MGMTIGAEVDMVYIVGGRGKRSQIQSGTEATQAMDKLGIGVPCSSGDHKDRATHVYIADGW